MLATLDRLALEVKYLDRARAFYEGDLEMTVVRADDAEAALSAGETTLVLRRPTSVPRGGLHTHFAFSIPAEEYGRWRERLGADRDLTEREFGSASSLYLYDPDGNCVELGQTDVEGPGIDGVFEVVLEVADLERAVAFYEALGFEAYDRGGDRRRVRLAGPMDLELWEPQLGIADARGGVHVDLGFLTEDADAVEAAVAAVRERAAEIDRSGEGALVRDPDGHYLEFRPP